jgi:predicted nucleic acid-binding protein
MSASAPLQFVDTNLLVYAHDASAGEKHGLAKEIIRDLWESEMGCLSVQVLQKFYVVATQKVPEPLEADTAAAIIRDLSHWKIHVPDAADVLGAIDLQQRTGISFWDAMILWSALQLDCEIVLSEDLNPNQAYDGIDVINPFSA